MARREIVRYPDARLKTVCPPVARLDDEARRVARDLQDTLSAVVGTGLAAPQIGELTRLIFVDAGRLERYAAESHGPLVLVNPVITDRSGTKRFREGCLSLPEFTATVKRSKRVTVEALGLDGEPLVIEAEGFEAILLQHEIDHLDGILFIDRVDRAGRLQRRGEDPLSDE